MLRDQKDKRDESDDDRELVASPEPSANQRAGQKSGFVPLAQDRPGLPNIVSDTLDRAQDGQAALNEELDVGTNIRAHALHQRHPAIKKITSPLHFKAHQLHECGGEAPLLQVGVGVTEMESVFLGNVNTIDV